MKLKHIHMYVYWASQSPDLNSFENASLHPVRLSLSCVAKRNGQEINDPDVQNDKETFLEKISKGWFKYTCTPHFPDFICVMP